MSRKHYLVHGHTAKGFRDLISSNLQNLNKLYVLKGGPAQSRTNIMKSISSDPQFVNYSQEYLHCPSDLDDLDGVLFPELGVGIVDGTAPNVIDATAISADVEVIDLSTCVDVDKLSEYMDLIQDIQNNQQESYMKAYEAFAKGIKVHDEWEKIYIDKMDFKKADQLTEVVYTELIGAAHFDKESCVKHRFFGGSTPLGAKDFVEQLTENISERYFIKGRPGSGKSTMLKKLQRKAQDQGIDVEVYHCGFDPDSLDMLLFPELNLCIFDSTSPHEYYPSRDGDSVIDMYQELIIPGTDEAYEAELNDIVSRYKSCIKDGTAHLAKAKYYRDILDKLCIDAADLKKIDKIKKELCHKISDKSENKKLDNKTTPIISTSH